MSTKTKTALHALFLAIQDDPKLVELYGAAQDAVEREIQAYADAARPKSTRVRQWGTSSALRAVYERAWAADPRRTELDLIVAGRRDLAAELGDWWLSEQYRAAQAAERLVAHGART